MGFKFGNICFFGGDLGFKVVIVVLGGFELGIQNGDIFFIGSDFCVVFCGQIIVFLYGGLKVGDLGS